MDRLKDLEKFRLLDIDFSLSNEAVLHCNTDNFSHGNKVFFHYDAMNKQNHIIRLIKLDEHNFTFLWEMIVPAHYKEESYTGINKVPERMLDWLQRKFKH